MAEHEQIDWDRILKTDVNGPHTKAALEPFDRAKGQIIDMRNPVHVALEADLKKAGDQLVKFRKFGKRHRASPLRYQLEWHHVLVTKYKEKFEKILGSQTARNNRKYGVILFKKDHKKLHPHFEKAWGAFFENCDKRSTPCTMADIDATWKKLQKKYGDILARGIVAPLDYTDWKDYKRNLRDKVIRPLVIKARNKAIHASRQSVVKHSLKKVGKVGGKVPGVQLLIFSFVFMGRAFEDGIASAFGDTFLDLLLIYGDVEPVTPLENSRYTIENEIEHFLINLDILARFGPNPVSEYTGNAESLVKLSRQYWE